MKIVQLSAIDMTMNNFLKPLNKATQKEKIEVHCICGKGPYYNEIISDGFEFHNVNIERKISPFSNLKSIFRLIMLFRKIQPTIVHVHTPVASVLGRIAAKIAKIPVVIYTAHGFYFHEGMSRKQYNFYFSIEKIIGRFFTDYIFTQSCEDYEIAKKYNFLKKKNNKNYVLISNGIDLRHKYNYHVKDKEIVNILKYKHKIPENNVIVTFIGRLVKEKGILDLLEAMKELKVENITLVIMGGLPDGERDIETFNLLEEFQGQPNIIFTGHVNNAEDYLYTSDIFCLPSYREGMPRSIIEAMAMKNAILATNIRGSREEVIHEENGFLFNTCDSKAIAGYIELLAQDSVLLEKMKNASMKRAHLLYDEQEVISKQLQIFKKFQEVE